jgi:hypothetical protein
MFEYKNNKNSIGREINGRVCVSLLNSHPTVSEIRYSIYHNTNCEMLQNWTFLLAHPLPSLISTIECDSWQLATPRCITLFMYCRHSYQPFGITECALCCISLKRWLRENLPQKHSITPPVAPPHALLMKAVRMLRACSKPDFAKFLWLEKGPLWYTICSKMPEAVQYLSF